MMNIFALTLVLTSLITGTVWSPPPPSQPSRHRDGDDVSEVIVKEGHRVVVVEYEKEADGHTKVLISPHHDVKDSSFSNSNVAGEEEEVEKNTVPEGKLSGPRELVCDAFGKCKHKLAHALGKTKEKVSETKEKVSDKAYDIEEQAKEAVCKAKETVSGFEERVKKAVNDQVFSTDKDSGCHTAVSESLGKAKESTSQGIKKAKEIAGDVMGTVKESVRQAKNFDVVDSPKRMGEDIQRNVTGKIEEGAEHMIGQAKETAQNVQKGGQKNLGEMIKKLHENVNKVLWFIATPEKFDAVVGLIHMLGFSTAYGMCVWVTFVSSYILGRYLPRQQFGMVQSRIYPVYFRAMAYCVGAALLGHVITQRNKILSNMVEFFQGLSLFSALLMLLSNMMLLEPKSTKIMFERMRIEKEEGRGVAGAAKDGLADAGGSTVARPSAKMVAERHDVLRMNEQLKKLNTYSSALNVSTLVVLTWHMAYMGQRLQGAR